MKKMIETLFGCFSGKQRQQKRSKLDLERKLFRKKLETKQTEDEGMSWQKPSADVMENILQRVNVGDRIRLSIVSKPWNSIVTRRDIRGAPHELPWLLLPHPTKWKYLSFLSLSEGKVVKLKPPKPVRGGWIYGSTKGSLIIIKEQGLKSTMFLVNPISGALDQLPPFKTIPSFRKYTKTREWKRFGANLFCSSIAVSMSDNMSDNNNSNCWTMAAAIIDYDDCKTLGVCRPGDKKWSVFQVFDSNQDDLLMDILFSSGTLYALVHSSQKNAEVAATRTLKFEDDGVRLKLKLVYDKHENKNESIDEMHSDYMVVYNAEYRSMLSESTNNEVLIIHPMLDAFWRMEDVEGNNNNGVGDGNVFVNDQDYDNNEGNIDNNGGGLNIVEENNENIYQEHDDEANNENNDGDLSVVEADEEDIYEEYDDYDNGGDLNIIEDNEEDMHEDHDDNNHEEDNHQDEEAIDEEVPRYNPYMPARSFRTYKIDPDNDNFVPMQSLGNQLLFLGEGGSFSLPASDFEEKEKNCIYFATNYVPQFQFAPKTFISREIGVFYFSGERIERSFPSLDMSPRYQPSWFTPCF